MKTLRILLLAGFALTAAAISHAQVAGSAVIAVAVEESVSYVIINAGGFLGVTKHEVAVPVHLLKRVDDKLVLAGASRDALLSSPRFEYAN